MRLTSDGAFVSVAVGVRARVQAAAAYSVTVTASGNGGDRARAGTVRLMKEGTGRRDRGRDGSDWQGMRLRGAGDTGRQQQCGFAATVGCDLVTGGFTNRPGGGTTRVVTARQCKFKFADFVRFRYVLSDCQFDLRF